jgi:hypothetical protein
MYNSRIRFTKCCLVWLCILLKTLLFFVLPLLDIVLFDLVLRPRVTKKTVQYLQLHPLTSIFTLV